MKKPRMNPMLVMESTNLLTYTAMRAARSRIVAEKYIELPLAVVELVPMRRRATWLMSVTT